MPNFIHVTRINTELFREKNLYDLDSLGEPIALNSILIESLKPAGSPYYSIAEKDIKGSNGSIDGTPTLIRMMSGQEYLVAETKAYIERLIAKS